MSKQKQEWVFVLDIGSKCSAYCFATREGQILKYGKYVAKKGVSGRGQQLLNFSKWLSKVLNGLPYMPIRTAIEAPYYSKNIKTFGGLSRYAGVAERELYRITRSEPAFIAPSAVKAHLQVPRGRTHAERKHNMVKEINRRLGLKLSYHKSNKNISDDDIADAIGLCITYCARLANETS